MSSYSSVISEELTRDVLSSKVCCQNGVECEFCVTGDEEIDEMFADVSCNLKQVCLDESKAQQSSF